MANIEERIETLIEKTIENLGYQLYDVQYAKEGKDYYLRILIESAEKTISLQDCEIVNNAIEEMLDTADYIKEQYFLEVSSTGVEKIIRKEKHLEENIGELVTIKLFKPVDKSKEFIGKLKKFDDKNIYIEIDDELIELERKNISLMKKYFNWDETE